ncbi:MAG: dockerin type I repeat-containing protein, partial [Bacteroidales bacterium]|nr:dockerin type I repeat-containing protein [Candidatus Sodaliphilus fimicaballi]
LYIETSASIPANIFKGCTGLRSVTNVNATPQAMNEAAFSNYNIPLFVNEGKEDTYKASDWKLFRTIVKIGTDVGVPGDLNGDGIVDIADVNAVIDMILTLQPKTGVADVNDDGAVDVADMNAIINIILQ